MKYYKLIYDYDNDEKYINCNVAHIGKLDKYCLSNGVPLKEWGNYYFEYSSKEGNIVSDYIGNVIRWFIVTDVFVDYVINELNENNYQILPVKLIDTTKTKETMECKVLNILDVIDKALDLENSKYDIYELDDEKILSVEKFALYKEKILNHDIFRINEDLIHIFVSEKVKLLIEKYKLKGFQFLEIYVS